MRISLHHSFFSAHTTHTLTLKNTEYRISQWELLNYFFRFFFFFSSFFALFLFWFCFWFVFFLEFRSVFLFSSNTEVVVEFCPRISNVCGTKRKWYANPFLMYHSRSWIFFLFRIFNYYYFYYYYYFWIM